MPARSSKDSYDKSSLMKFSTAAVVAILCCGSAEALAQDAAIEGAGHPVGEGTVVHPSVSATTGFVSNVFYEDETPVSAGVLQVVGKLAIMPIERAGDDKPDIDFLGGAHVQYEEFLSGNSNARAQRNLGLGLDALIGIRPTSTFPVTIEDHFLRSNRPTNFESNNTLARDLNSFKAGVAYRPEGRNISGRLGFKNTIDVFESDGSAFANRILNEVEAGVDWQFLPITRFYAQASYGLNSGLGGSSTKVSSSPIRGKAGVNSAITEAITVRANTGYSIGGYSSGASFSGFTYHLGVGYRYSPVGRIRLVLDRDFKDSLNANFYGEYMVQAALDQQVDRVLVTANVSARLRTYEGIATSFGGGSTRDDIILSAAAKASYELRDWLGLNASYAMSVVSTDYISIVGADSDDPSYARHDVMLGATAAF